MKVLLLAALLLAALLLALQPVAEVAADTAQPSESGSPVGRDSLAVMDLPLVTIHLEKSEPMSVARIEPWPGGFLLAVRWDGREEFVPAQKVRSIVDSEGHDVTTRVLRDRQSVGVNPPHARHRAQGSGPPLLGRPLPEQSWFLLTETGVALRADEGSPLYNKSELYVLLNAGAMKNVSRRFAVGGSVTGGGDDYRLRFGLKARVRYWIDRSTSIDLAPGVLLAGSDDWGGSSTYPGFTAEAAITFDRWLSIVAAMESVDIARTSGQEDRDVASYVGLKAGGGAGIVAAAVGLLALAATRAVVSY